MNKFYTTIFPILLVFTMSACEPHTKEPEPVDEAFTQELNADLEAQLLGLSESITDKRESNQGDILENLAEDDRQSLIDETIDDQDVLQADDAEKLLKAIESAIQ